MKKNILFLVIAVLLFPSWGWTKTLVRISEDAQLLPKSQVDELVVINGSAEVAGRVLGNVVVVKGDIRLRPTAYISGDVICLAGKITTDAGAIVVGSKVEIGGKIGWKALPFFTLSKLLMLSFLFKLFSSLILLLLCIFLMMMWPDQIRYAAAEAAADLVKASLAGVLAITLLLPMAVGFAITIFGLPISFALIVFLLVAGWFGVAAIAYLVGNKISPRFSPLLAVVVGLIILKFIHFVPFIGGILYYIALLPGLGAILLTRFGTNKPWLGPAKAKMPKRI